MSEHGGRRGTCQNPEPFPEHPGKVKASLLPTDRSKVILSSSSEYPVVTQFVSHSRIMRVTCAAGGRALHSSMFVGGVYTDLHLAGTL